jgi:transcriptional regulator with XRE-family HTH domain
MSNLLSLDWTFDLFVLCSFAAMNKTDVRNHFGTLEAVAQALNISRSAVSQWRETIPQGAAYKLQVITGGRLRVDAALYSKRRHRRAEALSP